MNIVGLRGLVLVVSFIVAGALDRNPATPATKRLEEPSAVKMAGWHREADGRWWQKFHAHLEEWEVVGGTALDESLRYVTSPHMTLPAGWEERTDGTFFDNIMKEVSATRPVGFQNEGSFKAYLVETVDRVRMMWDRTLSAFMDASDQTRHAQKLPLGAIQALLRIAKAPSLYLDQNRLADLAQRNLTVYAAVSAILSRHIAPPKSTGTKARLLFIGAGQQPSDFYPSGDVPLPAYLQEAIRNPADVFATVHSHPCTTYTGGHEMLEDEAEPVERDPLVTGSSVTSELAVPLFIRQFLPSIQVDIIDACHDLGHLKNTSFLDQYDFIYLAHLGSMIPPQKRWLPFDTQASAMTALRKTRAALWVSGWLQQHNNKSHIPLSLIAEGVPAVDSVRIDLTQHNASSLAASVLQAGASRGWKAVFFKPDGSAFMQSLGLVELSDSDAHHKVARYLAKLQAVGLEGVAIQKYIPSVKLNYEIRMYFVGGKWVMTMANRVDALSFSRRQAYGVFEWDWLDIHGGKLNSSAIRDHLGRFIDVKTQLVPLAELGLKALVTRAGPGAELPNGARTWPILRVDLGCCLEEGDVGFNHTQGWFVNEAEAWPDWCMKFFHRMVVNDYSENLFPFQSETRVLAMLRRAAQVWYPITEHAGLEFARFILDVTAGRAANEAIDGLRAGASHMAKQDL